MAAVDANASLETISGSGPRVVIGDRSYPMRRLGISDVFRISGLIRDIYRKGAEDLAYAMGGNGEFQDLGMTLALGFSVSQDQVMDLFAYLLDVERARLEDPEEFPMSAFLQILEGVTNHPDIVAFFEALKANEMLGNVFKGQPQTETEAQTG